MPVAIEAGDPEQVVQLRGAALHVADEQDITHDAFVARAARSP
jgi:hypothetical protein